MLIDFRIRWVWVSILLREWDLGAGGEGIGIGREERDGCVERASGGMRVGVESLDGAGEMVLVGGFCRLFIGFLYWR